MEQMFLLWQKEEVVGRELINPDGIWVTANKLIGLNRRQVEQMAEDMEEILAQFRWPPDRALILAEQARAEITVAEEEVLVAQEVQPLHY